MSTTSYAEEEQPVKVQAWETKRTMRRNGCQAAKFDFEPEGNGKPSKGVVGPWARD